MKSAVPEPGPELTDVEELFLGYLDYYRGAIARKLEGMPEPELRSSRLPSGWTPLELLTHLIHMERRWFRWGFQAERLDDPWGDLDEDRRWRAPRGTSLETLLARLDETGEQTREIVRTASLGDVSAVGGRFDTDDPLPTLGWILFHVLQEYARHAGHLDIVRELVDGHIGE